MFVRVHECAPRRPRAQSYHREANEGRDLEVPQHEDAQYGNSHQGQDVVHDELVVNDEELPRGCVMTGRGRTDIS